MSRARVHGGAAEQLLLGGAYGLLWNAVGLPAGVVPVTRATAPDAEPRPGPRDLVQRAARGVEAGSAGLPLGVQVAARAWREDVALAVMRAVEAASLAGGEHPGAPPIDGDEGERFRRDAEAVSSRPCPSPSPARG